ncbi:MAG: DUF5615 family PIN-like protein [Richelia sp. SM1_7_0]|nr:DUF5615 family PIN-like protein [Richelia sp. SM1_7_0]
MVRLYADEQFPRQAVELLGNLGYDILTTKQSKNAGISDEAVLDFATNENRAVLTFNRRDFFKLHKLKPNHSGIIACKEDTNWERLAKNIDVAISLKENLTGKLVRVNRASS